MDDKASRVVVAGGFLMLSAPVLLFPELLPAAWRFGAATALSCAAIGIAALLLRRWGAFSLGVAVFAAAAITTWAVAPSHDAASVRHFTGIGIGLLAMAIVAEYCTTTPRLMSAALLFTAGATLVLTLGMLSSTVANTKFTGGTGLLPTGFFESLQRLRLPLPGLESTQGRVNPNGLGGTALMLLPVCGGIAAAALGGERRYRLVLAAGIVATAAAAATLGVSRSRAALLGGVLMLVVMAFRWREARTTLVFLLLALTVVGASAAYQLRAASPVDFAARIQDPRAGVAERSLMWRDGVERLREAPWFGVGINRYREISSSQGQIRNVPHVHNTLLQVALDVGLVGLTGYLIVVGAALVRADRAGRRSGPGGRIAAGAGFSLIAVHFFGIGDAIPLGAKVGLFQWLCLGLILAASRPLHEPLVSAASPAAVGSWRSGSLIDDIRRPRTARSARRKSDAPPRDGVG